MIRIIIDTGFAGAQHIVETEYEGGVGGSF